LKTVVSAGTSRFRNAQSETQNFLREGQSLSKANIVKQSPILDLQSVLANDSLRAAQQSNSTTSRVAIEIKLLDFPKLDK
jgi:hypothetical protein